MKHTFLKFFTVAAVFAAVFSAGNLCAQDNTAAATPPATEETVDAPKDDGVTFLSVVWADSYINLFIWIMLFATSIGAVAFIIDGIVTVKAEKIMPRELADAVRSALEHGDLDAAVNACEITPSPLANILASGLNNVSNGYSVVLDSVSSAAEIETEKLMQRVSMLNMIAALAPMLGLMGTVVGMVFAFATLSSATGQEKATLLAQNIAIALYTTLYGLLVAVPATLGYTFVRNHANKLILTMEMLTYDLLKVLKDAEVVDEN